MDLGTNNVIGSQQKD